MKDDKLSLEKLMFVLKILVYLIFTTLSGRCYYIYTSEEAEPHRRQTIAQISVDGDYSGTIHPGDCSPQC